MSKLRVLWTILLLSPFAPLCAQSIYSPEEVATVVVPGIDSDGPSSGGTYGVDLPNTLVDQMADLLGVFTGIQNPTAINQITLGRFYGDEPPAYYNQADIDDVQALTDQYGGGIPRYAMIMAKYIRHVLDRSGATQVNVVGLSMGGLVSRWMIENDYEALASSGKIARWLTIEGVVTGNYAATEGGPLVDAFADDFDINPIDLEHMRYEWIEDNLHNPRDAMDNPLFANMLVIHWASTDDDMYEQALTGASGEPNDGIQLVRDARFQSWTEPSLFQDRRPALSHIHETHQSIKDHLGIRAGLVADLTSRRRVRVTLTEATVFDIHEDSFLGRGEIVFTTQVYSPLAQSRYGIEDEISEIGHRGHVMPVVEFDEDDTRTLDQTLFDNFVLPDETELRIDFDTVEIDNDAVYGIAEFSDNSSTDLDSNVVTVSTLSNGTYTHESDDWSGTIEVEVFLYPEFLRTNAVDDWQIYQ